MNILVTGGAGFIGSHISDALIDDGHKITIVDNLSIGKIENVPSDAEFIRVDITDKELSDVFEDGKFDIVYHLAAQMDVRVSVSDPVADLMTNIAGSVKILSLCVEHNVKRFIFASSGGTVYGEQEVFPASESHSLNPICPYGVAKLAVEKYMYFYYREYGINAVSLRYGNVYGPRQNPMGEAGVVAIFCHKLLSGVQPYINGDGLQTRDYIYVNDVVRANLSALKQDGFHILNIGTGKETNVVTIFDMLSKHTGSNAERKHREEAPGEQRRSVIDPSLVGRILNWYPTIELEEGLALTVKYFKEQY